MKSKLIPSLLLLSTLLPNTSYLLLAEESSSSYENLVGEAHKLIEKKDYQSAATSLDKALELQPNEAGFYECGLVYSKLKDFSKAHQNFSQAAKLNPANKRTWYQLGLIQSAQKKFSNAVGSFKKAIYIDPGFADAYMGIAIAKYWLGDKDASYEQISRLKKIHSEKEARELEGWLESKEATKPTLNSAKVIR